MTVQVALHVGEAGPEDAAAIVEVIHAAFGARPPLDPPGTAMSETVASVRDALSTQGGLLARVDGHPAGAMLFDRRPPWLELRRVSVHPRFQHRGVATAMVGCAEEVAGESGLAGVRLVARVELPPTLAFWRHRGYLEAERVSGVELRLAKRLPVELTVSSPEAMDALGVRLAGLLRAGDLVLLAGELGAGKTTLTRGIGAGLGVRGEVTSPTFVISRVHPALRADGPALVHADAYRVGDVRELDDLDLDTSLAEAVTVVEWGEGLAEGLSDDRLEVTISRLTGDDALAPGPGDSAADPAADPDSAADSAASPPASPPAGPAADSAVSLASDPAASRPASPAADSATGNGVAFGPGRDPRDVRIVPHGRRWLDVPLGSLTGAAADDAPADDAPAPAPTSA